MNSDGIAFVAARIEHRAMKLVPAPTSASTSRNPLY
jgi:hypothetical protein